MLNPSRQGGVDTLVPTAAGALASSRGATPRTASSASGHYATGAGAGATGSGTNTHTHGAGAGRPMTALGHTSAAQAAHDMIRELGIKGAMRARPRSALVLSASQQQQQHQQHQYAAGAASARLHQEDVVNYDGGFLLVFPWTDISRCCLLFLILDLIFISRTRSRGGRL